MMAFFKRFLAALCAAAVLAVCAPALADDGVMNLLLIGVDSASNGQRGRSDTMMLARIDPQTGTVHLASFLRDLYVAIPGVGKTRLNAAYHYGGEALLKQTLQDSFGVQIDRMVTVHFSLLAQLIDQVGGVEIDIAPRELNTLNRMIADYNADYGRFTPAVAGDGMQLLDGTQALCYSRIRKIDSDFQRASRQQTVIRSLLQRLSKMSRWDLLSLALSNLKRVETDVSFGDVLSLLPLLSQAEKLKISSTHVPFDGAYRDETIGGMMVLMPDLARCREKLQEFWEN